MIWMGQILQGVLLGGYYALIACGLSFMFGVMRIINLAHGSLTVVAAYLVWTVAEGWGISPFIALAAVLPIMALAGWMLQRTVLESYGNTEDFVGAPIRSSMETILLGGSYRF